MLSNLLNNAAKYTDAGGEIVIVAQMIGPEVEIRVRDNGIGISAELLPNVFDLFIQADQSPSRARRAGYRLDLGSIAGRAARRPRVRSQRRSRPGE